MNLEKFTDRAKGFLQAAQTVAIRMNHQRITPEHILKALLEDGLDGRRISQVGLAVPLAFCLAGSVNVWDVVIWGSVTLVLQQFQLWLNYDAVSHVDTVRSALAQGKSELEQAWRRQELSAEESMLLLGLLCCLFGRELDLGRPDHPARPARARGVPRDRLRLHRHPLRQGDVGGGTRLAAVRHRRDGGYLLTRRVRGHSGNGDRSAHHPRLLDL